MTSTKGGAVAESITETVTWNPMSEPPTASMWYLAFGLLDGGSPYRCVQEAFWSVVNQEWRSHHGRAITDVSHWATRPRGPR